MTRRFQGWNDSGRSTSAEPVPLFRWSSAFVVSSPGSGRRQPGVSPFPNQISFKLSPRPIKWKISFPPGAVVSICSVMLLEPISCRSKSVKSSTQNLFFDIGSQIHVDIPLPLKADAVLLHSAGLATVNNSRSRRSRESGMRGTNPPLSQRSVSGHFVSLWRRL